MHTTHIDKNAEYVITIAKSKLRGSMAEEKNRVYLERSPAEGRNEINAALPTRLIFWQICGFERDEHVARSVCGDNGDQLVQLQGCWRRYVELFHKIADVEYVLTRYYETNYIRLVVHTASCRVHHTSCGLNHWQMSLNAAPYWNTIKKPHMRTFKLW